MFDKILHSIFTTPSEKLHRKRLSQLEDMYNSLDKEDEHYYGKLEIIQGLCTEFIEELSPERDKPAIRKRIEEYAKISYDMDLLKIDFEFLDFDF